MNSQLLNNFLKSRSRSALTHMGLANTSPLNNFNSTILNFPLSIIKRILRNLLTSPIPLVLQPDPITTHQSHRTHVEPNVLQVCKAFHNIGVPILYGENTLTASSPATSFDFDAHLLSLPGSKRQMIRSVRLEIDWGDRLWAKFPLVARALGQLKGLQRLEIVIVVVVVVEKGREDRTTAFDIEADTNLSIQLTYAPTSIPQPSTARHHHHHHHHAPAVDRTEFRVPRDDPLVADAMLKAEMKMLKDLVSDIKGLKYFRLSGFRDQAFARCLEESVRVGKR